MALRVSLEILGGRPERGRICRPAIPSFRYRLRHLTPHDGAMPRWRAAPVTLIPPLCISTFSSILSRTCGSLSLLRILSISLYFMPSLGVPFNVSFAARRSWVKSGGRFPVSYCCDLTLLFGGIVISFAFFFRFVFLGVPSFKRPVPNRRNHLLCLLNSLIYAHKVNYCQENVIMQLSG